MKIYLAHYIILLTLFFNFPAYSVSPASFEQLLVANTTATGPGKAVVIVKNGEVIFSKARGMANIELGVPLSTDSVFRIGSLTKQFTAAAIMLLQEQDKLSINDSISIYLPEFPTEGHNVTIAQLMSHTSGLANYTDNDYTWGSLIQEPTTLDEMLALFSKEPMHFPPGEAMRYSNTGYVLLGKIIEIVSKQSYQDFIVEHIFNKLAMKNSQYGGRQIITNRAAGYAQTTLGFENATSIDMSWPYASGSLVSTVNDLAIWYHALANGKIISSKSYQQMIAPFQLNNGQYSAYGFGLENSQIGKYKTISHVGAIQGYTTYAVYIPALEVYIAVAANYEGSHPETLAVLLAAKILAIETPNFQRIEVSVEQLKTMMGTYTISPNSTRQLFIENGTVYAKRDGGGKWEVIPMSMNSFYYKDSLTYFVIEKNKDKQLVMNFYSQLSDKPTQAIKEPTVNL